MVLVAAVRALASSKPAAPDRYTTPDVVGFEPVDEPAWPAREV